ncbi:MAG: hypothetical protein IRZ15_02185 [Bryobacteraceae bacterium]|nr:hypothetical protein [Bryobacteraceae bacterium]
MMSELMLIVILGAPLVMALWLAATWLAGLEPGERTISRTTAASFVVATAATGALAWTMYGSGWAPVIVDIGNWFAAGAYSFPILLVVDRLSLPLLALTVVLSGLIGSFSSRYLHREAGYLRFFLLLHVFAFGAEAAFAAGSFNLLIVGWELVGLSSVMLIAFFNQRMAPVKNAIRAFAIYRVTDIGLLLGVFLLHHAAGSASCTLLFRGLWPQQETPLGAGLATAVAICFLFAAAGKSAQAPFSGWLPRAMEGPTPSSAIFYGGISVHLGVYLLLRAAPIIQKSPIAPALVVFVGLVTAILATLSARTASDAKTSLALATLGQLGVIFTEAGLGFERLALLHLTAHAIIRTLQFLRVPSMLRDYRRVHAAAGGNLSRTGLYYEALLPINLRRWLYRLALDRCHLDTLIDRFARDPILQIARRLTAMERAGRAVSIQRSARVLAGTSANEVAGG